MINEGINIIYKHILKHAMLMSILRFSFFCMYLTIKRPITTPMIWCSLKKISEKAESTHNLGLTFKLKLLVNR